MEEEEEEEEEETCSRVEGDMTRAQSASSGVGRPMGDRRATSTTGCFRSGSHLNPKYSESSVGVRSHFDDGVSHSTRKSLSLVVIIASVWAVPSMGITFHVCDHFR